MRGGGGASGRRKINIHMQYSRRFYEASHCVGVHVQLCVHFPTMQQCEERERERERGGNDDSRKRREGNTTEGGERVRESPREDQRTRGLTLNMEKDMFLSAIMRQTITWINK